MAASPPGGWSSKFCRERELPAAVEGEWAVRDGPKWAPDRKADVIVRVRHEDGRGWLPCVAGVTIERTM